MIIANLGAGNVTCRESCNMPKTHLVSPHDDALLAAPCAVFYLKGCHQLPGPAITNQPSSARKNSHDHHSPCCCAPHLHCVLLVWLEHQLELAILADGEHCTISVWISRAHRTANQQMNLKDVLADNAM
jgi:hypothetical protein